jgi:pimeloyl-ACP methyl ester carboxylesterase
MTAFAATVALAALTFTSAPTDPPRFADARLATGVRLRYAELGDPAAQPLILLHGYSDSWFSYSRVLPGLARRHRVYALDLRGHGDSDRPAGGYTMPELAADVVAFMDAKGIERATVVGHSMGSFVAQQVAVRAPERVTRLVLVGSATRFRSLMGVSELSGAVHALSDPVPPEFAREFQVSTIYRPVPEEFLDRAVAESLKLPARVWRAVMAGMLATGAASDLGKLGIPTLILWGERDSCFARSEQEALAAAIPGAVLKVYPETGHALHWERPEEFVRDLEAFASW